VERNPSDPSAAELSTRRLLADGASPVHAQVQAFWEGGRTSVWLAPRATLTIGRSSRAGLRIDHPSVSREHASLKGGNPAYVVDQSSANGVFVRGVRIPPLTPVAVFPGDVIALGTALVVVQQPATLRAEHSRADVPPPATASVPIDADRSPMQAVHRLIDLVSNSDLSVLLLGETGVGKTTSAEALHEKSPRAKKPFLKIHCPSFPETLLESELFGHERGAFTGATQTKPGLFESADGGTVFLDEIGELPLSTQAKLLSVVENREVLRLGSLKSRRIDVRFVTATNRELEAFVASGKFREDLFFRLNGLSIVIPPLRERVSEIARFARQFLELAAARAGRPPPLLADATVRMLEEHPWPGNLRELKNVMERILVLWPEMVLQPEHFVASGSLRASALPVQPPPGESSGEGGRARRASVESGAAATLRDELNAVERERIERALDHCNGNQSRVAKQLGMSRRSLIRRLEAYGIQRPLKGD
jgi:DNA-binding NtrC family response regulator